MTSIQIKRLPEETHRRLVERASRAGLTLTAYVAQVLENHVARPTMAEWLDGVPVGQLAEGQKTAGATATARRRAHGAHG